MEPSTSTTIVPPTQWLSFRIQEQSFAIELDAVRRVVRAVAVTQLPEAPGVITGVINLAGAIVPVVNLRRRFHLPDRPVTPQDQFIIARVNERTLALVVDEVCDLVTPGASPAVAAEDIAPGLGQLKGVLPREDGMMLITDLLQLLSMDEEQRLSTALEAAR